MGREIFNHGVECVTDCALVRQRDQVGVSAGAISPNSPDRPMARAGRRVTMSRILRRGNVRKTSAQMTHFLKEIKDVLLARLSVPRQTEMPRERKRSNSKGGRPKYSWHFGQWTTEISRATTPEAVIRVRQTIHVRQNSASRHRMVAEESRHRSDAANIVHAAAQFLQKIMQRTGGPHEHLKFFVRFGEMRRPRHRIFFAAESRQFVECPDVV